MGRVANSKRGISHLHLRFKLHTRRNQNLRDLGPIEIGRVTSAPNLQVEKNISIE